MLQTLFYIPERLFGVPLFNLPSPHSPLPLGLLFWIWAVAAVVIVGRLVWRHGFGGETPSTMLMLAVVGAAILFILPNMLDDQGRGLPIRGYGVMLLLGVVSAVGLALHRAQNRGLDPDFMLSLALWLFVGGIVGARAFYVIEYWDRQFYKIHADGSFDPGATLRAVVNVSGGGIVFFGAAFGGAVAGIWFLRKHRRPVLRIGDVIAPSMALGLAIGRIGCFLNGCCFGGPVDLPWAVTFPQDSPPYQRQLDTGQLYLHGLVLREQASEKPGESAVVIAAVEPDSGAAKAGLKPGQRIVGISAKTTRDSEARMYFPAIVNRDPKSPREMLVDHSLAAAERVLMAISGEGTQIEVSTDGSAKSSAKWTLLPADEIPPRSLPVHPTQIYSAIDAGLLCLLLLAFDPFRRREGEVLALLLTVHPIARFLLESIRTDEPKIFFGMSISQLISVVMLLGAAVLWAYILVRQPRLPRAEPVPAAA